MMSSELRRTAFSLPENRSTCIFVHPTSIPDRQFHSTRCARASRFVILLMREENT
jgi:hypothetical protein